MLNSFSLSNKKILSLLLFTVTTFIQATPFTKGNVLESNKTVRHITKPIPQEQESQKQQSQASDFFDNDSISFNLDEKKVLDSVLGNLSSSMTDFDRDQIYKGLKKALKETPLIPLDSSDDLNITSNQPISLDQIDKIEESLISKERDALLHQEEMQAVELANKQTNPKTSKNEKSKSQKAESEDDSEGDNEAYVPKLNANIPKPKEEISIFDRGKKSVQISQVRTTVNPKKIKATVGTSSDKSSSETSNNNDSPKAKSPLSGKEKSDKEIKKDNDITVVAGMPIWKRKQYAPVPNTGTTNYKSVDFLKDFYAKNIQKNYVKEMINSLSSSYFQGRATRTRGQRISMAFLNYELEKAGYKGPYNGSFIQVLKLADVRVQNTSLKIGKKDLTYLNDYHFDIPTSIKDLTTYNVIFIGKGKASEIQQALEKNYKANTKNAVIVTPSNLFDIKSLYKHLGSLTPQKHKKKLVVLNNQPYETERMNIEHENRIGKNFSRKLSIDNIIYNKKFMPTLFLKKTVWNEIYGAEFSYQTLSNYLYHEKQFPLSVTKVQPQNLSFKATILKDNALVGNLVALGHGFDPNKENVIISASYDGQANTSSANYNATGIAAMLSLAKIYGQVNKKVNLKKNIIFLFFVGNRQGNLGAKFYTTFPSYPHVNTFLNIGLNGIGVQRNKDPKVLYASCSKHYLVRFNEFINKMNLKSGAYKLDFVVNKDLGYVYTSDAWQFGQINIPFIEFTDSPTPEKYINAKDGTANLNYDLLMKRIEYIAHFLWNVCTSEEGSRDLIQKKALIESINLRK